MKRLTSIIIMMAMMLSILPSNVFAFNNAENASPMLEETGENLEETFNTNALSLMSLSDGMDDINENSEIKLFSNSNDITRYTVLVLDTSGGVDFRGSSGNIIYTADTSISYVKQAANKFVTDLQKANGTNYVALVTYNSSAKTVSEFSTDVNAFSSKINSLSAASKNSTDIAAGLEKANALLDSIEDEDAIKNVVLFTTGFTMAGNYNYTGHYNESTVGSNWMNSGNGVKLYAYANVAYEVAKKIKPKATIYSLGLFNNFNDIPVEGKNALEFFKLTAHDIATSSEYFYDVKDPNEIEFAFGEIADDIIEPKKNSFKFGGYLVQSEDTTATYYYDDAYFYNDASVYNRHLATMSLCFELTTWTSFDGKNWTTDVNDESPKFINARNLLVGDLNDDTDKGIGFDSFDVNDFWSNEPTKDSIGAVAAKKTLTVNDEQYTLIALGIRGGGYGQEWASNFTIGKEGQHDGFATAKENVLSFLEEYISKNNISGKIKLWIVGFSRAGATANLVAGALNDGYALPNNVALERKDLYAYTFEAPQGALENQVNGNYSNIHNTINVNDIVPLVAPSVWGFARYNSDEWLPSGYDGNFSKKLNYMKSFYAEFEDFAKKHNNTKTKYKIKENAIRTDINIDMSKFLPGGDPLISFNEYEVPTREVLTDAVTFLTDGVVGDRETYYTNLQAGVRTLMAKFMGGASWGDALGGGTLTFEEFIQRVCNELTLEKTLEIMSPIWAFNLDSVNTRLDKVKSNISTFVSELLEDSDLWGNIKFAAEIKDTLVMLLENAFMEIAEECLNKNITPLRSVGDVINLAIGGMDLFQPHHPEICLAWLMSLDTNYNDDAITDKAPNSYRIIRINCPVDVAVYDANNNLISEIINDEPQNNSNELLTSYINSNGEKLITLPANDDYRIVITPTANGTLNYSINEVDLATMAKQRVINYYNIPIENGNSLYGTIPSYSEDDLTNSNLGGSNTNYTLLDSNDTLINADEDLNGADASLSNYTVSASSNDNYGMVLGGGIYTKGSFAQVEAFPLVGSSLIGWYNGDTLVSTDKTYRFAVTENINLVAKFEEVEKYTLNFKASTGGKVTNVDGEYTAGTQVSIEAVPETGYIFAGWSSDSGVIENKTSSTTWFTVEESDATVTATFKKKSSGGGGGTSSYTIKFETNGGNKVSNKNVRRNNTLAEPTAPIKDGFTFAGWYTDKELTKAYDFSAKVTKGFTLYAKWEDIKMSQIILTIGEKDALVFGETKENDVAPKIVNDRTMLPIRFIAEALGAEVIWTEAEPNKVVIKKDDIEIVINIGSDTALVNNKKVELDSPAFIENDRTYLPLRFVSENLGAKVEWIEDTQQVIITK